MDEHSFIRAVHAKLNVSLRRWKIHDQFAGGVPDAYYLGPTSDLWIEYKYAKTLPKRPDTSLANSYSEFTELQKQWLNDLHRCNRPCALVIGHDKRAIVLEQGSWNNDVTLTDFIKHSISRKDLVAWIEKTCL